ncbi:HutD/Ves family protein [Ramlibacter sp. AN1133]|uniref:HutD/Ves family protein n=1 Tax=Ramlibacter sp. AN1133 TaxID=3133429 RepID=UPI0030C567CE
MSWSFVCLASVASIPWRNGGGVTRELLAWPGPGDWQVRLSVADVQADGPFSRFPGIERWFAVLDGAGVVLRLGDRFQRLTPASEAFRFDGGELVDCALTAGATIDFNLMAAPARARMRRVRGSLPVLTSAPAIVAVYGHAHGARIMLGNEAIEVPAAHLAWRLQDGPLSGVVQGQDALWMEALR